MSLTIEQFLSQILPAGRTYAALAIDPVTHKRKQYALKSPRDVAVWCLQADVNGYNAFYAMAGFEKGWHDDPLNRLKPDGTVKKVFRTAENAAQVKAFWLDLDCGVGKDYPDQASAIGGIKTLMKAVGLPVPLIVNSGNGIHCYWVLTQAIPADMWRKIAALFAGVVAHVGVPSDAQCTADCARVLRPVETHNHKDGANKLVAALTPLKLIDPITFVTAVKNYAVANGVKAIKPAAQNSQVPASIANNPMLSQLWNNGNFQAVMGHAMMAERNKDADRIISHCEQVRDAGESQYPGWWGMLTVMNCCPSGRDAARNISMCGAKFHERTFEDKYTEAETSSNGPASCNYFDRNNPGICDNCAYHNKIVTPAELGRIPVSEMAPQQPQQDVTTPAEPQVIPVAAPVKAPPAKALDIKGFVTYPLEDPRFLMREGQGLVHVYEEEVPGGDPIRKEHVILDSCFYLLYSVRTNRGRADQQMNYMFQITNPFDKPRQASMSAKDIGSDQSIRTWLFNNQMLPTLGNEKKVIECMRTYIAKLQRRIPCMDMREQFGWATAKNMEGEESRTFVVGEHILYPNQPRTEVALPPRLQRYSEHKMTAEGTLEGWKAVPKFYERNNIIWGQLGIALAFGAPLMPFAPGIAKNGIVNYWSTISGTGKTTLQHAINSVWGHPETQLLNIVSTSGSRFAIMGMRRNLPTCINEITNLNDIGLSDLLFQMSEGREKDRLADGGKDMMASGSWSTIAIMSSNNTVFDKMQLLSRDRDGEIKRVLELEVNKNGTSPIEANEMTETMNNNYGHAGEAFIQRLLDNPELLRMIPKAMNNWVNKHIASQDERFWMNTIAAAVVAAKLANAMGLTNIDIEAISAYAMEMVKRLRYNMDESRKDIDSSLNDYLADSLRDILMVTSAKNANQMDMPTHMDSYVRRLPLGEMGIRIEKAERLMYIRSGHLREWCREHRISEKLVVQIHLAEDLPRTKRMTTGVASLPPVSAKCWVVRIPEEIDLDQFTDVEPQPTADGQAQAG
jgi:hypothetical protein